jgi:hypothetical protein
MLWSSAYTRACAGRKDLYGLRMGGIFYSATSPTTECVRWLEETGVLTQGGLHPVCP